MHVSSVEFVSYSDVAAKRLLIGTICCQIRTVTVFAARCKAEAVAEGRLRILGRLCNFTRQRVFILFVAEFRNMFLFARLVLMSLASEVYLIYKYSPRKSNGALAGPAQWATSRGIFYPALGIYLVDCIEHICNCIYF